MYEQYSVKSRGAEYQQHTHGFASEEHEEMEGELRYLKA